MDKKNRIVISVYDMEAKVVEDIELDPHVFDGDVKKKTLYQAILAYRANQRMGQASTKTRGEVSGGGKKPWKQKGTGRARHGSIRSPLWRHGGVVFGPHPRDFAVKLPEGIRRQALRSALNSKIKSGDVTFVEKIHILHPKTKEFVKFLNAFKLGGENVLCVIDSMSDNIKRASKNIPRLKLVDPASLNALDVLNAKKLLLTRDSLKNITKHLKNA